MFRAGTFVGLDIGTRKVKIVEMAYTVRSSKLSNLVLLDTPVLSSENSSFERNMDIKATVKAIKEAIKANRINAEHLTLLFSSRLASNILLSLPPMPKAELKEVASREAKIKMVPTPSPTTAFDFTILDTSGDKKTSKLEVLVIGLESKNVEQITEELAKVGLLPQVVTLVPFACSNVFRHLYSYQKGENVALIDIGDSTTFISIAKGGYLRFFRHMPFGFRNFTDSLAKRLGTDFPQAESLLLEYGIPSKEASLSPDSGVSNQANMVAPAQEPEPQAGKITLTPSQLKDCLQPQLERLSVEIRRSFIFYQDRFKEARVNRIYLSGGGAMLADLPSFLKDALEVDSSIIEPLKGVQIQNGGVTAKEARNLSCLLTNAVGLTLELADKNPGVNFLPLKFKEQLKRRVIKGLLVAFFFILGIVYFASYFVMDSTARLYKTKLQELQVAISILKPLKEKYSDVIKQKEALKKKKEILKKLNKGAPRWEELLKELSNLVPEGILLNNMTVEYKKVKKSSDSFGAPTMPSSSSPQSPQMPSSLPSPSQTSSRATSGWKMNLSGKVAGNYYTTEKLLEDFRLRIEDSHFFKEAALKAQEVTFDKDIEAKLEEERERKFNITAQLE